LNKSDGRLGDVVADDEIDLANIEALFSHASSHEGVVPALSEPFNNDDSSVKNVIYRK
jgi:hypothetical protein